ncbi:MAG: hypothetical protein MZV70_69525 [Desulfobacterales bacterium]|nr:hypothetical protein [Desulfobacterales bacterium]
MEPTLRPGHPRGRGPALRPAAGGRRDRCPPGAERGAHGQVGGGGHSPPDRPIDRRNPILRPGQRNRRRRARGYPPLSFGVRDPGTDRRPVPGPGEGPGGSRNPVRRRRRPALVGRRPFVPERSDSGGARGGGSGPGRACRPPGRGSPAA